jgi:energy-coupling factor transport system substrate-specific component
LQRNTVKLYKILNYLIWFLFIPGLLLLAFLTGEFRIISALVIVLALIPFFLKFESRLPEAKEVVLLAVLTALTVVMRIVFSPLPFFKPVTALIILAGLAFGSEAGFLIGALSALLSNFYYSQGIWTPYQMFAWGLIGSVSGLMKGILKLKKAWSYFFLLLLGVFSAFVFAFIMDIQTVLFIDNYFNLKRFILATGSSFPYTMIHVLSNVFFLFAFGEIMLRVFVRIKTKYFNH